MSTGWNGARNTPACESYFKGPPSELSNTSGTTPKDTPRAFLHNRLIDEELAEAQDFRVALISSAHNFQIAFGANCPASI